MSEVYRAARQRMYGEDTPLVDWLRRQRGLESSRNVGFVRTDLDGIWYNYVLGLMMIWEDKTRLAHIRGSQQASLAVIDQSLRFAYLRPEFKTRTVDKRYPILEKVGYCGLHTIRFENTGPEDGVTFVDDTPVDLERLKQFFQFQWTPAIQVYQSLADLIDNCSTAVDLQNAVDTIKKASIPTKHPERKLLIDSYWKQKAKIDEKEEMPA